MTDWYKMNPVDWNDGTDDLTLEQEAAYLRICHAIYITERPIRDNGFVVAGLLRCNDRKAKRLIAELVEAGKLEIVDGHISNRRAVEEISNRNRTRMERKSAGSRGGVESGKSRSKSLKDNDQAEAIASTQNEPEENREEEIRFSPKPPRERFANPIIILQGQVDAMAAQRWVSHCEQRNRKPSAPQAEQMCEVLAAIKAKGGNATEALSFAISKGWYTLSLEYFENAGFKFGKPKPGKIDWPAVIAAFYSQGIWYEQRYGPRPGEPGCQAPPELIGKAA